jgi:carbamoyl-phosphate synthase large subunit
MTRVLVFPSCNEPGLELVRSLVDQPGLEVHGGSYYQAHEDASASILKKHAHFPVLGHPEFRETLARYIREEKIDIVFPSMEKLVSEFSTWTMEGVSFVTQSPEVAAIVESKEKTYSTLQEVIPLPEIYGSLPPHYPAYGKPVAGSGGRDHVVINNSDDLKWAKEKGLLVTEYLPGDEIVAYNLSDLDGNHLLCVTKTMGRWRGGASQLGALKDDPTVRDYASAIAAKMKLIGPWFAQFKKGGNGTYKLMEVNARLGGAMGICRLAGINLPLMTVKMFAGQPITIPRHTNFISWVRNLQTFPTLEPFDLVVWSLSAFSRPSDGKLRPHVIAALFDLANRNIVQECYGPDFPEGITQWGLNNHFRHRHNTLGDALVSVARASRAIFVSDDHKEQFEITETEPEIRVVSASALEVLGKEKL